MQNNEQFGRKPKKVNETLIHKQQTIEDQHIIRKVQIDYGNSKKD